MYSHGEIGGKDYRFLGIIEELWVIIVETRIFT